LNTRMFYTHQHSIKVCSMNIDRETVRKILTEDLDMRKVCIKMVPQLTEEQKQRRVFSY